MAFTPYIPKDLAKRYAAGESAAFLSSLCGMSRRTFQRQAALLYGKRSQGGQQKYFCDETVFDKLTEQAAYWIGFLLTDGNIHNNRVRFSLQKKDSDHVKNFKKFLKTNAPVCTYSNGMAAIEVRSPKLVQCLGRLGVIPNKTLVATAPEQLTNSRHFWRGVVDGDGCLHISKIHRYRMQLCLSGSHMLVAQFISFVRSIVPCDVTPINKGNFSTVNLSGTRYARVVDILYKNAVITLSRKHKIAKIMMKEWA